jgi:hypothetical protein
VVDTGGEELPNGRDPAIDVDPSQFFSAFALPSTTLLENCPPDARRLCRRQADLCQRGRLSAAPMVTACIA